MTDELPDCLVPHPDRTDNHTGPVYAVESSIMRTARTSEELDPHVVIYSMGRVVANSKNMGTAEFPMYYMRQQMTPDEAYELFCRLGEALQPFQKRKRF